MLCPKCGAYSPYNTSVCNRCGSKLTADGSAAASANRAAGRQYYRNARPSGWQRKQTEIIGKVNDAIDRMMADSKKRLILLISAAVAAAVVLGAWAGCVSCMCGGCSACGESAASNNVGGVETSSADVLSALPPLEPVSGADAPSGTDVPSSSDVGKKVIIAC